MSGTLPKCELYACYYRNPKTRVFERLPHVTVLHARGRAREIMPAKYSKWYTIEKDLVKE